MIAELPEIGTGWIAVPESSPIRTGDESFDGTTWSAVHPCWHGHLYRASQFNPMRRLANDTLSGPKPAAGSATLEGLVGGKIKED